jgi:hypothetical protein
MSEFSAEPKKRDEKKMCAVCAEEFLINNTRQHYKKRSHLNATLRAGLYCPRTCTVRHPGTRLPAPPDIGLFPDKHLQSKLIYTFGARKDEPKTGGVCMVCSGLLASVPAVDTAGVVGEKGASATTAGATAADSAGADLPLDDARFFPTFVLAVSRE